jgi:hypothetical protein
MLVTDESSNSQLVLNMDSTDNGEHQNKESNNEASTSLLLYYVHVS